MQIPSVIKHNSLDLARKYNQILVQVRQYLLLKTHSFPEATLSKNCCFSEQTISADKYEHISRQMEAIDFIYTVQE